MNNVTNVAIASVTNMNETKLIGQACSINAISANTNTAPHIAILIIPSNLLTFFNPSSLSILMKPSQIPK